MSDEEFDKVMDSLPLTVYPHIPTSPQVNETDIIPDYRDVFVIRHPRFTRPAVHMHNYQTLTLASLAEFFHYSEPHLSTLIKQNTGCSFTTLVKQLRMADAISYLVNTHLKISEIAEYVGYNSADHFSRVFRSAYQMSPQEYRRKHQTSDETFTPFAMS